MRVAYRAGGVGAPLAQSALEQSHGATDTAAQRDDVRQTSQDLLRAMGGGLFIGLPLLFTMEMWFHSFLLPSWKILVLLAVSLVIVVGYTAASGFRRERTYGQLLVDSLETIGIAAVVATVALLLLGRVGPDLGLRDAIGKIALETIPVAFGVSLAGTQLATPEDRGHDGSDQAPPIGPFGRLVVSAGGALLFALNVAPTEEPVLLGVEAPWWLLLAVVGATVAMTFAIVFFADFRGGRTDVEYGPGPLGHPVSETIAAYAVSLLVSLLLLWSFGRTDGVGPSAIAGQVVMLGVVASFGAAAGRLLVGGHADNGGSA
jgi:putative integral membrane protein (TIGR02587 family)